MAKSSKVQARAYSFKIGSLVRDEWPIAKMNRKGLAYNTKTKIEAKLSVSSQQRNLNTNRLFNSLYIYLITLRYSVLRVTQLRT